MEGDDSLEISGQRLELLEYLLREEDDDIPQPAVIRRADRNNLLLSFAQTRLWFLDQLQPESSFYNIPLAWRLVGSLNLTALQRTFSEIVRRHEVLRTTFTMTNGSLTPIIGQHNPVAIPVVDFTRLDEGKQWSAVRRLTDQETQRCFNLSCGPLLRTMLLRVDKEDHVLLITMHHVVSDEWSVGVLTRELTVLYEAYSAGLASPLPDLPIQYADYAMWQREWLQGEVLRSQLAYWRSQLSSAPVALELPTDRPRPAIQSYNGAAQSLMLPASLSTPLRRLGRSEGATLFMLLLAAFKTLLYRYTGQTDIVVGTPIAGRDRAEIEDVIGFFVNTLVLRTDLSGASTFVEVLARVRKVCLGAYAHQDLPFDQLVEELQPERDPSRNPFFQVLFSLQNASAEHAALSGLRVSPLETTTVTARVDLTLMVSDAGAELGAYVEYNTDLFDAATIARLLGHYQMLLMGIVAAPAQPIDRLPLLTRAEQHQLLVDWNATATAYPHDSCIHERFALQALRTPDVIAVVYADQHLTYHELHQRADLLAGYLRQRGVAPDVRVGICAERSLELTVGIVGILKAGGVYIPLDPAYPQERLAFMLADSAIEILLTQARYADTLPAPRSHVLCLDADWTRIAYQDSANPATSSNAASLAYVIYTSGSTGTPKGVAVAHSAISRLICNTNYITINSDDRIAQASNASFDATTFELWGALIGGATLVGLSKEVLLAPRTLARALREQHITTLFLTTALFNQIAREMPHAFQPLHSLLFGGERVEPRWVMEVLAAGPPKRLLHVYGPTESTTFASWHPIEALGSGATALPIGRPLANTQIYLLDRFLNPVPIGVVGELYIGGAGLARGYLGRPDLTAERFVPNPFGTMNDEDRTMKGPDSSFIVHRSSFGSRLYRTGDLARYLPDGAIEFIGRADHQVKLRGYRIELGEIETLLGQHPAVRESLTMVREDVPGDKRLVAYVVPAKEQRTGDGGHGTGVADFAGADERRTTNDESSDSSFVVRRSSFIAALREFLQSRLPHYMLPSAFVILESLPLSPNGKVDRQSLPPPGQTSALPLTMAPQTPMEELVAGMWQTVLRVPHVGRNDNFFELGGHSLLATQILSRIHTSLDLNLSVRSFFENPTVAGVALALEQLQRAHAQPSAPPIVRVSRQARRISLSALETRLVGQAALVDPATEDEGISVFPLSFAQARLWFLDQLAPGNPFYNVPMAWRLTGALNTVALERAIGEIVRRHEVLRTIFAVMDGQPVQAVRATVPFMLLRVDLHELPEAEREATTLRHAAEEAQRPFDLARGPLLRAALLHLGQQEHALLLTMHHIVVDEWSIQVFFHELSALYSAYAEGSEVPLSGLPIQYADYAVWQREYVQGNLLSAQLAYWRSQLSGALALLELPTDHSRPPVQSYRGASYTFTLSERLSEELKLLSQRASTTLYMALVASWKVLLFRYTGQVDMMIGSPIAGRNRAEIEGLIGCFLNMLVLRTDLSGNPGFYELLGRVREVCLEAYAHQELPFERLVEELQPERGLSHTPFIQVVFDLHNSSSEQLSFPQLALRPLSGGTGTAKFDLSLTIQETNQGLAGEVVYSTDLFAPETITRMLGNYQVLLEGIVAHPTQPIAELPLLTESERLNLLITRNDTTVAYPSDSCIHHLFAAQVERTPDSIAVVHGAQCLTYQELDARANQLARHLQNLGVGPEVRVGICAERSLELVVALLGIFKSGGAFLPLEPTFPKERMAFMLADGGAAVVLTQGRLLERLPDNASRHVCLDTGWDVIAQERPICPASTVVAEDLAYVIYTSGSTGRPKGVMVSHRSFANYLVWCAQAYSAAAGRGAPVQSSIAADAIFPSLFAPLLVGTSVVLLPEDRALETLNHALQTEGNFSLIKITPSQLEVLNQQLSETDAAGWVHTLVVGAEALRGEIVSFWQTHARSTVLLNEYGPTETVVGCSIYRIPATAAIVGPVPIGLPIANTQFYVLDRQLQLVPIGVPGELYIGGDGVTWGYLNRPDLTAERFIPDPFRGIPGARLYKTGDSVRYLADDAGNIEFLGRTDDQIKIRGYRIEPGEIATVLNQHKAVRQSLIIAHESRSGDKRLVAYVVPLPGCSPSTQELRSYLKELLPEYMVPSAFVLLQAMPLAPHGKINRKALPPPNTQSAQLERQYLAPSTPAESALAAIWSDVLGVERIGVNDTFFELGGHSLLAIRLVREISQQLRQNLPLSLFYQTATIKETARFLDQNSRSDLQSPIVAIQPHGSKRPFFCVSPGDGNALWFIRLAHHLGPDQPFYGLQDLAIDKDPFNEIPIADLAADYIRLMRDTQPEGPYFLGGWSFGGLVAFAMAHQLKLQGHEVGLLAIIDSIIPCLSSKTLDEYDADFLAQSIITMIGDSIKESHLELYTDLRRIPADERLEYLLSRFDIDHQAQQILDLNYIRRQRNTFISRLRVSLNYQMDMYPGRVTLFRSDNIIDIDHPAFRYNKENMLHSHMLHKITADRGWGTWSTEPVQIFHVSGSTHDTIALEPYVRILAKHVSACLEYHPIS